MSQNYEYHYGQPSGYAPRTSASAVASLVLGILGLVQVLPLIGSIGALILGYAAKNEIARSNGMVGGEGLAKGGIILGWIGVGLAIIGICLVVLVFAGLLTLPFGATFCDQMSLLSRLLVLR